MNWSGTPRRPRIIVLGNEKGGSGKSTTAMHVIVALLKRGFSVGCIDLDARQGTLSRQIENRRSYAEATGSALDLPELRSVLHSGADLKTDAQRSENQDLDAALHDLADRDYIVIDTPGSDSYLSRLGHACADTLITPLNDSFLDLDVLARVDVEGRAVLGPSTYSQMVWEQRQARAKAGLKPIDWIVTRNRLSHVDARNKREIAELIELLARRIRFRTAPGFGERVIFRELFPKGLTLLDLRDEAPAFRMSLSHVAARQEVRALIQAIGLPDRPGGTADTGAEGSGQPEDRREVEETAASGPA
jgi:chromosome partitioning protein